jgi:hypothetical protein
MAADRGVAESILEAPDYGSSYTPLAGQELLKELEAGTMLDRLPSLAEAGDLAASWPQTTPGRSPQRGSTSPAAPSPTR